MSRITRRSLLLGGGAVVATAALIACGAQGAPSAGSSPSASGATPPMVVTTVSNSSAGAQGAAPAAPTAAAIQPAAPASPTPLATAAPATAAATASPAASKSGDLVMANTGSDYDSLDPQVSGYEATAGLAINFLDSLIWEDAGHKFWPGLATSWDANADATAYTFHLRNDVVFHDGTPFNAKAVQINYDRIMDPATQSKHAITLLGSYDKTEVVDDYTVTIHFKTPYGSFLDAAARSNLGIASPTALQKYGKDFGRNPVGSGFMKFQEWTPNKQIVLVRNATYNWGCPAWGHPGPAYLNSYKIISLPDAASAVAAFQRGEIFGVGIQSTDVAKYANDPTATIVKQVLGGFPRSIFMNVEKPPTDDVNVRKAIIYGTDPSAIVKISLAGLSAPAHGPLASTSFGYDPKVADMYHYDPAMAAKILDDAGWKAGPDGVRAKAGQKLALIMIVNAGWDPYTLPVQQQLKQVGIDVQIQTLSSAARVEANAKGQGNLAPLGFDSSDPSVLSSVFRSTNIDHGFAWSRYKSADLDKLLDQAAGEPDLQKRAQLYAQIQQTIMQNALIDPLVENTYFSVYSKRLHDYASDAQTYMWYHDAWIG